MGTTFNEPVYFAGGLTAYRMTIPAQSITDFSVADGANIDADKIVSRYRPVYAQAGGSASATERKAIHVATKAGTVTSITAGSRTACTGDSTISIEVKKNNTNVLSTAIVLDNGNTAYVTEDGTVSSGSLSIGDVVEVVVTVSAGSGTVGQGVFVAVEIDEPGA